MANTDQSIEIVIITQEHSVGRTVSQGLSKKKTRLWETKNFFEYT